MTDWLGIAIVAAVLYGLHQVFTRLAAGHIGEGLGAFVVESSAAAFVLAYLAYQRVSNHSTQPATSAGVGWSVLTGLCVGAGTIAFFVLFQRGGPLSAVPMILAGGAALMAVAGFTLFHEPITLRTLLGIAFALVGLYLLRS